MTTYRSCDRLVLRGIPTCNYTFTRAKKLIDRSAVLPLLSKELVRDVGRPRRNDLYGFLVATAANALRPSHTAEISAIAKVMNGFTPQQRDAVGLADWTQERSYDRANRLFNDICALDNSGVIASDVTKLDGIMQRVAQQVVDASISTRHMLSTAVAVDGTDIETFSRSFYPEVDLNYDGDPVPGPIDPPARPPRRTLVLDLDENGREILTKDPDARKGHRSATNSRRRGIYLGYELHNLVQTREVTIRNPISGASLGPDVPQLIRSFGLVEAGGKRAKVCRALIERTNSNRWRVIDVIADRGMTLGVDEWQLPLRASGKRPFFDLHTNQRGVKPARRGLLVIDGSPFSRATPDRLTSKPLPVPPRRAPKDLRARHHAAFAERGLYAWRVLQQPNERGTMRFIGPLRSGRIRNERYPASMRHSQTKPLVALPADWDEATDDGTVSVNLDELPLYQPVLFGSEAWSDAYLARRQAAESANAGLKRAGANVGRKGHFKVFTRVKITFLLAFEIASYNLQRADAFDRDQRLKARATAETACRPELRRHPRAG